MDYRLLQFALKPPMGINFSDAWNAQYPLLQPGFNADDWVTILKGA